MTTRERIVIRSHSEDQTVSVGERLGRVLLAGDLVAIFGELGAGKTRFVRGIAMGLGIDPGIVSSPTFVVMNEYPSEEGDGPPLVHVDAYRLGGADELESLGWDRAHDGSAVVAVEWAERLGGELPDDEWTCVVRIEADPEGEAQGRLIVVEPPVLWGDRPGIRGLRASAEQLAPGWATCPVTGKAVPPDSPTFPFFDERARLVDLSRWMSGEYVVSRDVREEDLEDPPPAVG